VPSRCSAVAGVCASAAADVGFRTKESGRRVVRPVPRGRVAPASGCVRSSSANTAARSRAARRVARSARP
jgi:hypothetical protein